MANTTMDVLYPEVWAAEIDKLDVGDYPLPRLVSNRNELSGGKGGDTVNVPLSADLGEADVYTDGSAPNSTNIAQESVAVTLNKSYNKTITLTSGELTKSAYDIIASNMPGMVRSLLRQMNKDIYLAALQSNYIIDGRTTFDETSIVDAYRVLDLNEVPSDGRILVAGPDDYASMLKFAAFTHADISGDAAAMREGKLPRRYGFEIAKANIITKYTPADVAGAVNNVANYTSADYTYIVDAFDDDANPIRVGDVFTVAGESGTPLHTVQSTTTTASDTTGITFLTRDGDTHSSVLDNAVITVSPTRSLLAMVPNAIAFASKPYANFESGIGARQMSLPLGGPGGPMARLSIYQKDLSVVVSLDALYGVSITKRKRVCRIITD